MKIKYSPCKTDHDTQINPVNENKILIDNEEFEFDTESVVWTDVSSQSNGKIIEAHRENSELYLTIVRFYTQDSSWDSGGYHDFSW